jgi:uncharacterized protein (TIGR00725 family)
MTHPTAAAPPVPAAREARDRAQAPDATLQIAVVGPRECTERQAAQAREVGERLARAGAVVICGGGTGVMAAVAAGAHAAGGLVVGIRPGKDREGASPDLSVTIVTNLGEARNAVIVWSADAVIAVGGSWGTLSEIALARRRGDVPVVVLEGWSVHDENGQVVPGFTNVGSPEEAVRTALAAAG